MIDVNALIAARMGDIDASGIRRVFDLGARLKDPINLSIGQPDFPVPDAIKQGAIDAIKNDMNGYTVTQGVGPLHDKIAARLEAELGWPFEAQATIEEPTLGKIVTSGTSGALLLACMALLGPDDEIIIPDPYFVMYPHLATIVGGRAVRCETYPDFMMTAERVAPLITERTKAVLLNSPGNPHGAVLSQAECEKLLDLCRSKGVLLISDEIYDEFCYSDAREDSPIGPALPSPGRADRSWEDVLVIRGFGKTYGVTGWRLGYAAGPKRLIEEMAKLQQYTFVCAPSAFQHGVAHAFDVDMSGPVAEYQGRRDMIIDALSPHTEIEAPGGAFYCFVKIPEHLGMTGSDFVMKCLDENVLVIPGNVFSDRDTHIRMSYATSRASLEKGLEALVRLMKKD